jgi:hypothetical protein
MEGRTMPDPDGMREAGWVLGPGGLHGFIKRISQEILAGFRLDGHKPIPVLSFQL